MREGLANKKLSVDKRSAGEELCIKPPFFKDFFQGFEEDLTKVGFKQGRGSDGLENFYEDLDRTATIIRIPSLPDDPDVFLL